MRCVDRRFFFACHARLPKDIGVVFQKLADIKNARGCMFAVPNPVEKSNFVIGIGNESFVKRPPQLVCCHQGIDRRYVLIIRCGNTNAFTALSSLAAFTTRREWGKHRKRQNPTYPSSLISHRPYSFSLFSKFCNFNKLTTV